MKSTPSWVALLAVAVQLGGLGLCVWAMESSLKRDRALGGSKGPDSLPGAAPAGVPPPPPFGATGPSWSPGTPPPGATA